MSRFMILRLTQAIKIGKADITFYFVSILSRIQLVRLAHHGDSRIVDDSAHPTALLAHPPGVASGMLVGYFLGKF
jgi:hypothetical protein